MTFPDELGLLIAGAVLALASSLLTSWLSDRRAAKEKTVAEASELKRSQRLAAMEQAKACLASLEVLERTATGTTPDGTEGYEYRFEQDEVVDFTRQVLLLPNEAARECCDYGVDILGGWHTLLNWGEDQEDLAELPYVQQRRSLREMRSILGSCARGDLHLPQKAVAYLMGTGRALDKAWTARIEDESAMREEWEAERRAERNQRPGQDAPGE